MEALLDTSFILSCVKQKIDFLEALMFQGYKVIVPSQVLSELEGLSKSKLEASLALKILSKGKYKEIELNGKKVDSAIITYAKANPETFIGTLDEDIKKKTRNRKIVIRGTKGLGVA